MPLVAVLACLVALAASAGEVEWRAQLEAGVAARRATDMKKSEAILRAAKADAEKALRAEEEKDPESEAVASAAFWLSSFMGQLNDSADAFPFAMRSADLTAKRYGADSPRFATSLDNLGDLAMGFGPPEMAMRFYTRSLAIREKAYGKESRAVATSLRRLAFNHMMVEEYPDSEPLYERAVTVLEKTTGAASLETAEAIDELANLYRVQARHAEALPLFKRSLAICEKGAPDSARHAEALENLGSTYQQVKLAGDAEPLFLRALAIREKLYGPDHMLTFVDVAHLKEIYDALGRGKDARTFERRMESFYKKAGYM